MSSENCDEFQALGSFRNIHFNIPERPARADAPRYNIQIAALALIRAIIRGNPQTLKLPIALVDQAGNTVGAFMMDPDGLPNIRLYGTSPRTKGWNREIWAARGVTFRPATGQ